MIDHRHCSLPATLAVIAAMVTSGAVLAQAPKVVLPPKGFVADPARGAALFQKHCIECHGRDARSTDHGPSLIHPGYRPDHHSDLAFYLAMQQGTRQHHWKFGDMKPVSTVTPRKRATSSAGSGASSARPEGSANEPDVLIF